MATEGKQAMTRKAKQQGSAKVVRVPSEDDNSEEVKHARTLTNPTVRAAVTVEWFSKVLGDADLGALIGELQKQARRVQDNDLGRAESMLTSQAHTLDAIFNELARRAAMNMGEYLSATETYLRLALKAQSQCRATLETLSTIKNPPVVFAKQANIANGPQQVNNGLPAPACEKSVIEQNELLEDQHGKRLDTGTTGAASGADTHLAALGAINRA